MHKKIVIPLLCLKHHGGVRVIVKIANEISSKLPVCIITPKKLAANIYEVNSKVEIELVDTFFNKKNLIYMEFIIKLIYKLKKYDLLIANFFITMFPVFLCSILYKKKYIYVVQDIESKRSEVLWGKIFNTLCELTYRSNFIITANDYLKSQIENRGKTPLFSFTVGVDTPFFEHPANNSGKRYDIIYFARSQKWKNLDMFLEFLVLFKERKLSVAIVSQEEKLFDKISNQNCIHSIFFIKPATQIELIDTIDLSTIFVGTSKKEGFYLPAIEAMARGVPVLLYPNGGSDSYFIDGENGKYFTDISQLGRLVVQLLSDANLYNKYSSKSKETALKFNMQANIQKVAHFITDFA